MMAGVKQKNTSPELIVRHCLFRRGHRYRLHDRRLPGHPDIVFPGCSAVILVHGCFWHGHDCRYFRLPATNTDFWERKIRGNIERDQRVLEELADLGWRRLVVWECAVRDGTLAGIGPVIDKIECWLTGTGSYDEIRSP